MKSDLVTIIAKEFKRFFGDKRLFFSTVLLPGLMIYLVYNLMGTVLADTLAPSDTYVPSVYMVNAPESAQTLLESASIGWEVATENQVEDYKTDIKNQNIDLLLVFPDNFDEEVAQYSTLTNQGPAPEIQMYYNSAATESYNIFTVVTTVFDSYEQAMTNKFDINREGEFDLATEADTTAQIFSMMVPMLLVMMLMSGCISVAPDAIAGEKERGTMATLLVTPAKRSSIALGKIISLAVFALLSAASSITGVLLSLPALMRGSGEELSAAVYSTKDYIVLAVVTFSTVLALVSIFAMISTFAKTIKEASMISSPVMVIGMVLGITTSMGGAQINNALFAIPIYNSCMLFNGIFSMNYSMNQVVLTIAANLVFMCIGAFVMTKMFNSERIMFAR